MWGGGRGDKGQGLSLQERDSHTYTLRLVYFVDPIVEMFSKVTIKNILGQSKCSSQTG